MQLNVPVYWRFKEKGGPWAYGYPTRISRDLVRMGLYNGDSTGGVVVDPVEIETRPASRSYL